MALNLRKKEPLLSLKWFRIKKFKNKERNIRINFSIKTNL